MFQRVALPQVSSSPPNLVGPLCSDPYSSILFKVMQSDQSGWVGRLCHLLISGTDGYQCLVVTSEHDVKTSGMAVK